MEEIEEKQKGIGSSGLEINPMYLNELDCEDEYGYYPDDIDFEPKEEYEEEAALAPPNKRESKRGRRRKQIRTKHYNKGYRNVIMTMLLTAGAIPYSCIDMLPGERIMYLRKLRIMRDEKIVELIRNNSKKIARLYKYEDMHDRYIGSMPEGYHDYYMQYGDKNRDKINIKEKNGTTAERSIRSCEIVAMMFGVGIGVTCEDKIDLTSEEKVKEGTSCYYTIRELRACKDFALYVKPEDKEKEHSMTSRILGLFVSAGGKYPVYHTGKSTMLWRAASEGQMALYISQLVNKKCEAPNMRGAATECIIIGQSMDVFFKIFFNTKRGSLSMENGYQYIYAVPYDKNGQFMLDQMTKPNWKEELNRKILTGYETDVKDDVTCDGIKDNIVVLNFCNGDIARLKRFLYSMVWHRKMQKSIYKIYCYDFQYDFVRSIVNEVIVNEVVGEVVGDLAEIITVETPVAEHLIKLKKGKG